MKVFILGSLSSSLVNFRGSLISAMCAAGHEVHVAAPFLTKDRDTFLKLSSQGVFCHDIALKGTGLNPFLEVLTLFEIIFLLNRLKPDLFWVIQSNPLFWVSSLLILHLYPRRVALITGLGYAFVNGCFDRLRIYLQWCVRFLYQLSLHSASLVIFQNHDDCSDFQDMNLCPLTSLFKLFLDPALI